MRSSTYKYVEAELSAYNDIRDMLILLTDAHRGQVNASEVPNIQNTSNALKNTPKGKKRYIGDELSMDRRISQMRRVVDTVERVYREADEMERRLMEIWYFKRPRIYTAVGASNALCLSERQFYKVKKKIVAKVADELGLDY